MKHLKHNRYLSQQYCNPNFSLKRRKALKQLKDLSILGIASSIAWNLYKHNKDTLYSKYLENADSDFLDIKAPMQIESTLQNLQSNILEYPFTTNLPKEFLSLPLKYFNIPKILSNIFEKTLTKQRHKDMMFIMPLLTSKDFNHTNYSLYHSYNVAKDPHIIYNQTSEFLQYHYDSLLTLFKDLQSYNFIIRDFRTLTQDSINLSLEKIQEILKLIIIDELRGNTLESKGLIQDKDFFHSSQSLDNILKYQVPEESSLYQEFKERERKGETSAIDAYNEALAILADYKDYFFTSTPKKNDQGKILSYKDDKNKARRLMQCLDVIGQNNIRALYVGTSQKSQTMKRPKFIGRLATTIIIEDGLWLG